jgi:thioredoxin 1
VTESANEQRRTIVAKQIDDTTFEVEVLQAKEPVLVDFYGTWCPPCRELAPKIDELAAEYSGRAKVVKVNVDDADQSAARYAVSAVPTLILFEHGQPVRRWVGLQSKQALGSALERSLAAG